MFEDFLGETDLGIQFCGAASNGAVFNVEIVGGWGWREGFYLWGNGCSHFCNN